MGDRRTTARFLFGGAGLLLVFSGCSDDTAPAVGNVVANTAATAPGAQGAAPSAAVDPATPTTVAGPVGAPIDGAALLQQAVAATSGGYHFNQTATVDGAVALTVDGDRTPEGARIAVSSDAGLVFYIITPDGTWLMPENGEWELDDSDPPTVDPIAALNAPTSVSVAANDGTTVQLTVAVPYSSLGLDDAGDASLQVLVVNGALNTLTYGTHTPEGKTAVATVIFGPVVDPTPIVAPI